MIKPGDLVRVVRWDDDAPDTTIKNGDVGVVVVTLDGYIAENTMARVRFFRKHGNATWLMAHRLTRLDDDGEW